MDLKRGLKGKRSTRVSMSNTTNNLATSKRSQVMQLPFGMLFSILLIAVFIFVAFYAIKAFLEQRDCSQVGLFINDLRSEVDNAWMSSETSSSVFSASLPSGIEYACFADLDAANGLNGDEKIIREIERNPAERNMFFYPAKRSCNMPSQIIEHINITGIISDEFGNVAENPYCIETKNGRINMTIEKGYYESLVNIKRA